ncbi:Bilirubin oxidase [Tenacibaculum amylolyticum]
MLFITGIIMACNPKDVVTSDNPEIINPTETEGTIKPPNNLNKLLIPELIDTRSRVTPVQIDIQEGNHEFVKGIKSQTKGFNGNYLGPTILMRKGDDVKINFTNLIGESTTVHGHGLHVPGNVDGGPQLQIRAGQTWDVTLPIRQEASTNWYHPHLMGKTAEHVHAGLAGLYLIEDDNSENLNLPKTYGYDDIPIVVQDRTFVNGVMKNYPVGQKDDLREPTLVINGTIDPYVQVPKGNVRLRLLNGSNARSYKFFIKGNVPFEKIATEGGFLEAPVTLTSIVMAPGERNEIIVDMSTNKDVELMAYYLPKNLSKANPNKDELHRVLYLQRNKHLEVKNKSIPGSLNMIQRYNPSDVQNTRRFKISNGKINDVSMDMNVINERVTKGILEKWIVNSGRHPFHMHGVSFLILSENGGVPKPENRGWKDTFMPNGKGEILLRFDYEAPDEFPYMYHCHILEHEDHGMMGQFTVK